MNKKAKTRKTDESMSRMTTEGHMHRCYTFKLKKYLRKKSFYKQQLLPSEAFNVKPRGRTNMAASSGVMS